MKYYDGMTVDECVAQLLCDANLHHEDEVVVKKVLKVVSVASDHDACCQACADDPDAPCPEPKE